MDTLDFTLDDLIQNRHRLMSPRQVGKVKRMRLEACVLPIILIWFAGAVAITSSVREPRQLLTFIVTASIVLVFAYMGVMRWIRVSRDLRTGKVSIIHGKVSVRGATRNVGYVGAGCKLTINNVVFIIPFDAGSEFSENVRYTLYLLPASKIILAAEKMRG
jgi:hypothetical protein